MNPAGGKLFDIPFGRATRDLFHQSVDKNIESDGSKFPKILCA